MLFLRLSFISIQDLNQLANRYTISWFMGGVSQENSVVAANNIITAKLGRITLYTTHFPAGTN